MASATCYSIGEDLVTSSNQLYPCTDTLGSGNGSSSHASCCHAGDFCMQDSICHYTRPTTNGTGYYLAGCTDPTWKDPACPKQCAAEAISDILYDAAATEWHCCTISPGQLNCTSPLDDSIDAPAPNALIVVAQLTQSAPAAMTTAIGVVTLGASSSATSSLVETTSSTYPSIGVSTLTAIASPAALSSGAIVGLILAVLVVNILLALGIYVCYRRRYNRKHLPEYPPASSLPRTRDSDGFDENGNKFIVSATTSSVSINAHSHHRRTSSRLTSGVPRPAELDSTVIQEKDGTPLSTFDDCSWARSPTMSRYESPHAALRGSPLSELAGDFRRPVELPGATDHRAEMS